ncbi:MAG: hypothetical protein CMM38_01385 [Rhodospirillaceae bacterium]|nr:hypothetical protein [Rhodospirillaceae bacterium]|tara:strand:+ start:573 stop:1055 length:483 start_codon:yes stop_codon:yes gene_type:complete
MIIETFKEKRSKLSVIVENFKIDWFQSTKWKKASYNTLWCLMGCAIGDLGTIAYFQVTGTPWSTLAIMSLAIIMGLLSSIILETIVLSSQMTLRLALKTALGMSMISMISMEISMNLVDVFITGGAMLTWWIIPIMLSVGFITPLPYNYWRLVALGKTCH